MSKKKKTSKKQIEAKGIVQGAFGNGSPDDCIGIVEDIIVPKEGGIFTKYLGCNYLFKGYPDVAVIDKIAVPKKILAKGFYFLNEKIIQILLVVPFLLFLILPRSIKRRTIKHILDYYTAVSIVAIQKHILKEERYKTAVKEIYRVLSKISGDKERDIFCMILEYDYAYLARFQDVMQYLDQEALKENPKKEFFRIIDILIERETSCLEKWNKMKRLLKIAWLFKDFRTKLIAFLTELDIKKIKPDEADFYYMCDRNDYQYAGLSYKDRMKAKAELDKKVNNKLPKIVFKDSKKDSKKDPKKDSKKDDKIRDNLTNN